MGISKKKMPRGKMRKWFSTMQAIVARYGYTAEIKVDEQHMDWLWERCEGYKMSNPTLRRIDTYKDYSCGNIVIIDDHIVKDKYVELGEQALTAQQKQDAVRKFLFNYRQRIMKKTFKK